MESAYDGMTGTAGGAAFGTALAVLAHERDLDAAAFARASGLSETLVTGVFGGRMRVGPAVLAACARTLKLRAIEFLQRAGLLSLDVYAAGLDPLFFLPAGHVRYDARIYMREINPRHAVPEGDMTKRNPVLAVLTDDTLLDANGKLEVELTYLLRAAVQAAGGSL